MEIKIDPKSIDYSNGLGISIPGYDGCLEMGEDNPCQFYIELSRDSNELKLYYWNNSVEPEIIIFNKIKKNVKDK